MNEKFFQLPEEKQQRMMNAAFRVFSENSYKKSPMGEIADAAGISKSLLFYYFQNKKDLYLFLWDQAAKITMEYLIAYGCHEPGDLFEQMERGMRAKFRIMEIYPHMAAFTIKAFYEKDEAVCEEIQKSYQMQIKDKARKQISSLDPKDFVPGLDLKMMYREMYLASEGYLFEMCRGGKLDVKQMESDFEKLLTFWKSIYRRENSL